MAERPKKGLSTAYAVFAVLVALMMSVSATMKLTMNPDTVKIVHGVVGVPLGLFPVFGVLLILGGVGLVVGIFRPKIGVAAGAGLVLYFVGAVIAHVRVGDFAGLKAPIAPLLMATTALTLRILSLRRSG